MATRGSGARVWWYRVEGKVDHRIEIEIEVDTREGVRVKRGSRADPAGAGRGEGSGRVCPDTMLLPTLFPSVSAFPFLSGIVSSVNLSP